jgi:hypothetical protein
MNFNPERPLVTDEHDGSTPWNSDLLKYAEEGRNENRVQKVAPPVEDVILRNETHEDVHEVHLPEGVSFFSDQLRLEVEHARAHLREVDEEIRLSRETLEQLGSLFGTVSLHLHGHDLDKLYRQQTHLRSQLERLEAHLHEQQH